MKKLALLLSLVMLLSMCSFPASAEVTYTQSPMLDAAVEAGELAPVEERLPDVPKIIDNILEKDLDYQIGKYGGTLTTSAATVKWDPDLFCGMCEALLTMGSQNSDVITPNIVEAYEVNEDYSEFIFTIRKGLKWSDGTEVTMEDYRFTFEDVLFNEEKNPILNQNFRTGGVKTGTPCTFEVIDDTKFKVSFDGTYGGFLVYLSVASWTAYADYLKPAHILKQFHPDYAEEIHGSKDAYYEFLAPFGKVMGYDDVTEEGVWVYIWNQVDLTGWEITDPDDCLTSMYFEGIVDWDFPHLLPWKMVSYEGGVSTFERNPYYFKVDAEGQQLPYIDYLTSTYVETMELQQMTYISGQCNFGLETVTAVNYPLYMENAEKGGYKVVTLPYHYTPTDIIVNLNYGYNADGSLVDDPVKQAFAEMNSDIRFRQALVMAIDAAEIVDSIYYGLAEVNPTYNCVGDIDGANDLLDEMGAIDVDGDGYRETPSGQPLAWQIWNTNRATDIVPCCELYCEAWREIGLNVTVNTVDSSYYDQARGANEVPMYCMWYHETQLWHYRDWGINVMAPLYDKWLSAGGLIGELPEDTDYLEPDEKFLEFYNKMQSLMTVSPDVAMNEVLPEIADIMANEIIGLIVPITNVVNPTIVAKDMQNIPTSGLAIAMNFAMEQFFFENPELH